MEAFLIASLISSMPILFGCLGSINSEKVGLLNLGCEGVMISGGIFGFLAGVKTDNVFIALICGMLAGVLVNLIFGFLTITLKANQNVTGLALSTFGIGLANTMGKKYVNVSLSSSFMAITKGKIAIPLLSDIPYIGNIFFNCDFMVYLAYILIIIMTIYYKKTKFGLYIDAVGEDPSVAQSVSINVDLYRYINIMLSGAIIALGGMYLSMTYLGMWHENITMGTGWISIALVIFAGWKPVRAFFGALLFAALGAARLYFEFGINEYFFKMVPYILTIVVLIFFTARKNSRIRPPKALGLPYFKEDR